MMAPAYTGVMATEPADAFFSDVDYKGAFVANGLMWLEGWTALSANQSPGSACGHSGNRPDQPDQYVPNPVSSAALVSPNLENSASLYNQHC